MQFSDRQQIECCFVGWNLFDSIGHDCCQKGSKKSRPRQVDFRRECNFLSSLSDGQGPRQAVRRLNF